MTFYYAHLEFQNIFEYFDQSHRAMMPNGKAPNAQQIVIGIVFFNLNNEIKSNLRDYSNSKEEQAE